MDEQQPVQQSPEVDKISGRIVVVFVCVLATGGMVFSFVLTLRAMNAATVSDAVALMGVGTAFFGLAALLIGGLVNAMTLRMGSNPKQLKETVALAYVPGSSEGMSAGGWGNVPHDPDHPTAQLFGPVPEPNADPTTPGPTIPTLAG